MLEDLRLWLVSVSLVWTGFSLSLIAQFSLSDAGPVECRARAAEEPSILLSIAVGLAMLIIGRQLIAWNERVKCRDATRREI